MHHDFLSLSSRFRKTSDRSFQLNKSDEVEVEEPIAKEMRKKLKALGHNIQPAKKPIGGSQAIFIDWETGFLIGGSDPRKDGCAIGY